MSLPLLHAGRTNPGLSAALDLRFALDKSLTAYRGPTPSFSRASTGSYFDGSGVLRYKGYNLCLNSENFSAASWSKTNISASFSSTELSPNGDLTASLVVPNTANNVHHINPSTFNGAASSYTLSIYAKNSGYPVLILDANADVNFGATFNLATGTVTGTSGGSTATITSVGNGWYRCSITKESSFTFLIWRIYPNSSGVYSGDGSSGVLLWGAQVERTAILTDYSKTTSSANSAPRFNHTYNGTSWVSRGLLVEEQRTNLNLQSNGFGNAPWSVGSGRGVFSQAGIISPDGTANAWTETCVVTTAGGNYYTQGQVNSTLNAGTYTLSLFAKAGNNGYCSVQMWNTAGSENSQLYFNLNTGLPISLITTGYTNVTYGYKNVGNGWYRIWLTITKPGGQYIRSDSYATFNSPTDFGCTSGQTNYFYGSQLELGAFPTSYIGTTNSSVVRSADVCQITGGDFSGFWNGTEGSTVIEFDCPNVGTRVQYQANSAPSTNIDSAVSVGTTQYYEVFLPPHEALITGGVLGNNLPTKVANAYKVNDFAISMNGAAVVTDSSGVVPAPTKIFFGSDGGSNFTNGHIARLRYFNKRLPNATLQLLSSFDFNPASISGLQLWLDASDASTLYQSSGGSPATSDGDPIGYWGDKSGGLKNAVQASGTNKPALKLSILNSRPVVRFDGVNDFLSNSMQWANSAFTIITVTKRASGSNYPAFVSEYSGTTNGYLAFGLDPSSYLSIHKTGLATSASNLVQTAGTFFIQSAQSSGISSGNVSVDVKSNGVSASSTLTLTGLSTNSLTSYGASKNGTTDFLNGDIAEIIVYNSVLSAGNLSDVFDYLRRKWGVY